MRKQAAVKNGDHETVVALCIAAAAPDASVETELSCAGTIFGFENKRGMWTRVCPQCHGTILLMATDCDIIAVGIGRQPCPDVPRVQGWLRDAGFQNPARHNAATLALLRANAGAGISDDPDDRFEDDDDIDPLKVSCALAVVDDDSYATWIRVAAALHNAFGDDGYLLFSQWSALSPKFDEDECAKKWRRGKFHTFTRVTIKTIFWLADQHDPNWRALYRQLNNEAAT